MKVYVIEKGLYSDRHIIAVVETEEEAEKISQVLDADYSEWDTKQLNCNRLKFIVTNLYDDSWDVEYHEYEDWFPDITETQIISDGLYCVFANSQDQARKIAQDMKAEELARKAGIV